MAYTKDAFLALWNNDMWELFSKFQTKCEALEEVNVKLDVMLSKINKLEDQVHINKHVNSVLKNDLLNMKRKLNRDSQYHRQENLEFSGILETIADSNLEGTAISLLKKTGVDVSPRDIVDCHRLKNGKAVICRFVNRKHCQQALAGSKKLKGNTGDISDSAIYINRNLIPEFNTIRWRSKKLKQANCIYSFGTTKRGIWVQAEPDGRKKQIEVEDDLYEFLPAGKSLSEICL